MGVQGENSKIELKYVYDNKDGQRVVLDVEEYDKKEMLKYSSNDIVHLIRSVHKFTKNGGRIEYKER